MCKPDSISDHRQDTAGQNKPAFVASPSRRRKLWELHVDNHCPVIGVGLPLATLRQLIEGRLCVKKAYDDYTLHVAAVNACASRNPLSELLQKELDRRYQQPLRQTRQLRRSADLWQYWRTALADGDVAGAFWAVLTHPCCEVTIQDQACRDMHMLQHQTGASHRADMQRLRQLQEENLVLGRELAAAQERTTRFLAEKTAEIDQSNRAQILLRAENIGKESLIASLRAELADLRSSIPALPTRQRLAAQIGELQAERRWLQQEQQRLRQRLQELAPQPLVTEPAAQPVAASSLRLEDRRILCVGGREGSVTIYRQLIERVGAQFSHHDGGREDNLQLLECSLAGADLVICQTACISHDAYWRVKDYCKRTGKRCVYVDNPSGSGLSRQLEHLMQAESET